MMFASAQLFNAGSCRSSTWMTLICIPESLVSFSKTCLSFVFILQAGGRKGNGRKAASHFEITNNSFEKVGHEGVIKGWTEEQLNMSRAVHYNPETGTFKVERSGVYFLYCQVHFNENQSQYVKLEVSVPKGPTLQCIEGYGTTPASGSHRFHFLKPCQVSGLLRLNKGAELKAVTGGHFSLQTSGKHYFGLFKVN
ncbi:tumor necrosis factor ligand superfamily [Pimephales promelas]|nr:tumor necrosis factor ligand superfamily [Pimephales promelas]